MTDVIKTQRLTLCRPQMGDAPAVARAMNDLAVSRWLTRAPYPYTRKDAREFIGRNRGKRGNAFLIFRSSEFVGCIGTARELGYWIGREHWGQGIVTESAKAIITHHFANGHARLKSGYFVGNQASHRVLSKLGFSAGSLERASCRATGKRHSVRRMYLTRKRWEATQ